MKYQKKKNRINPREKNVDIKYTNGQTIGKRSKKFDENRTS